jgi:hypothetical protein
MTLSRKIAVTPATTPLKAATLSNLPLKTWNNLVNISHPVSFPLDLIALL